MCGIVGYVGSDRRAMDVLLDGLRRLEYRGYDSAGVAIFADDGIAVRRALGKLRILEEMLRDETMPGNVGIGHTRWATHGKPSERNAHPHRAGSVVIVHNGIVENYRTLRAEIEAAGRSVESETDTELIAHLVDMELAGGLDMVEAVRVACARLEGSYALGALSASDPSRIVAAKNGGSPIILGLGEKESFLASDVPAILPYTRQMLFLEDGEFAVLSGEGVEILDAEGESVERAPRPIQWDPVAAEKGGYDRFMQKEIFEQPRAVLDTIGTRVNDSDADVTLDGIEFGNDAARQLQRLFLVACGTAYYSCMVGKYLYEQIAGIPVEVDLASEFRYRGPILDEHCAVVPVSQSGETADTLAALRLGKESGARVIAICNVRDATIARESGDVLYTHAGPEIGVASTKAFTTQVVAHYLLALKLGMARGCVSVDAARGHIRSLMRLPRLLERALQLDAPVRAIAQKYYHATNFLFLGRGIMYPIALEGALKLKEISYIHAEGYAAGEMKHGPIALIDEDMPVVVIANKSPVYDKVLSNLEQVRSRDGQVIAVASEGDTEIADKASDVIYIPDLGDHLTAILAIVPLQLLAYHVAVLKGTDVDQPRNLAKSVTVE
ncbi:MAG: glutamine--fructose-6-phosphate transaminase (isomerizing) [Myxococcota bacterium]|jgi:glucosamine--fructose-6-phosphate aminotransferase (isomerizing)|nr:glutamine--fructose-6-phosphate transaminase (isomerizing) [Deltaproteobacteria bacterium]MCP4239733.1 glutamine--fructose-6-phosphate transaminase (isomerizing) [bacterium]MDP6074452.1 glutamine--fructose-6-phosphate transaminase (isomerizing) [Myxococcota bacterium]MDP6241696.1 glutamine--fructose-6-phosphate transaminase (isomerizing) [Myxococcota bacterium]MDP7073837.1 glutamine--fructose-6-phosphate transaminase (isomerizing) [Myxococcota bacterium]